MDVFAHLPERIELDLGEVAILLAALDRGVEIAAGDDARLFDDGVEMLTAKLWPELGDLLGEE